MRTNTRPDRVLGLRGGGGGDARKAPAPNNGPLMAAKLRRRAGRSKRHTMRCGRLVSRRLGAGSGAAVHRPCGAMTRHFSLRGRALDQESNRCPVAHRPSRSHAQGRLISVCAEWKITDSKVIPIVTLDFDQFFFSVINQQGIIVYWWRRRESNPRPQALRLWLYMLSRVFSFDRIATRRAGLRNGEPPGI